MTDLPDRAVPPLQGDEEQLFARYDGQLRRTVGKDVQTDWANIEDGCAFAWAQLLIHQPRRDTAFGWLRVVARREATRLDEIERRQFAAIPHDFTPSGMDPRDALGAMEAIVDTRRQLSDLRPVERTAMFLRGMGWSYDEAARRLGMSTAKLNKVLAEASRRLGQRQQEASARVPEAPMRSQLLAELEREPPVFIRATIGRPPHVSSKRGGAEERLQWRRTALAIIDYRLQHDIDDPAHALGPPSLAQDEQRDTVVQSIHRYNTARRLRRDRYGMTR